MPRCLILLLISIGIAGQSHGDVQILASIKPLQLIAGAIVDRDELVSSLIPANQSPHHYSMRPSDRVALDSAQLIIWIGSELETFLTGAIAQTDPDQTVLQLSKQAELNLLTLRMQFAGLGEGGAAQLDPHLWLDTANALTIARMVTDSVSQIDPAGADKYRLNLQSFTGQIDDLNTYMDQQLQDVRGKPYIVYHDAYQYLEARYSLEPLLALAEDTEVQPGIRHILNTRRTIREARPLCLFKDKDSSPATIATMLSGYALNQVELDILGIDIIADADGYIEMMRKIVNDMNSCFKRE
ncbi:MAG: zinc ABC transporter substrate-binding protein [Pseudohongiellaceae bacterium]